MTYWHIVAYWPLETPDLKHIVPDTKPYTNKQEALDARRNVNVPVGMLVNVLAVTQPTLL